MSYTSNSSNPQHSDRTSKPKSSTKHLELHVASVYTQIADLIKQATDLEIQMPVQVSTAVERVDLIRSVLGFLLESRGIRGGTAARQRQEEGEGNQEKDGEDDGDIECANCQNYEKNLQKLENQIRNHIRTHQQLKLYQDGLEDKIEQYKKEKKESDKKYETIKKKYEQAKISMGSQNDKIIKLEQQHERLRLELRQIKQVEIKRPTMRYESNKENLGEWRNNYNDRERERERERERNSMEKRPESTERMRVSVNVRSTKGIPISSKIIQEKAKQDKAKALKNRIGF